MSTEQKRSNVRIKAISSVDVRARFASFSVASMPIAPSEHSLRTYNWFHIDISYRFGVMFDTQRRSDNGRIMHTRHYVNIDKDI